ncbi:MAG: hypothetical protein ABI539_05155 [Acidobacteriota bacterium]
MGWFRQKQKERGHRALARQLAYQEQKALQLGGSDELRHSIFLRAQAIRQKLCLVRPISADDRILEVGSGAHGLIFGFGSEKGVGIDPLAVEYKSLFPG